MIKLPVQTGQNQQKKKISNGWVKKGIREAKEQEVEQQKRMIAAKVVEVERRKSREAETQATNRNNEAGTREVKQAGKAKNREAEQ